MEKDAQNRRKNYFIKRRFQRNFIIKFCILVISGSVLSGMLVYLMSKSTVTTTFENCRLTIKSTADFILPAVLLSGVIVIVFIGLATVAVTLFTSHRIAGPLYRLERDVAELASGNLKKRFNLRHSDEIKALAESLDRMRRCLRDDIAEVKRLASELQSGFTAGAKIPKQLEKNLQDLLSALEKFDT